MKKALLFTIVIFGISHLFAQQYDPEKVNKKALALYDRAIDLLKEDDYKTAVPILLDCIKTDTNFVDAYLS
ncbi:MAG: hypothetical protein B7Z27_02535, partial [Sphingobacteriia bacterium 32-37-4]